MTTKEWTFREINRITGFLTHADPFNVMEYGCSEYVIYAERILELLLEKPTVEEFTHRMNDKAPWPTELCQKLWTVFRQ